MRLKEHRGRPWTNGLAFLVFMLALYGTYQCFVVSFGFSGAFTGSNGLWASSAQVIALESHRRAEALCDAASSTEPKVLQNSRTVRQALDFRSAIKGSQSKEGVLNPVQWTYEYKELRRNKTINWALSLSKDKPGCLTVQPPFQYPGCLVHINHDYKFIWIKGKKVGGTTIREPLGWICGDDWGRAAGANKTYCSERTFNVLDLNMEDVKQYWKDYFVFAFVRNPYSRYASSFTYIEGMKWESDIKVKFPIACHQPFFQAIRSRTAGFFEHHIHHIMEQGSCLFTENGKFAVDFVGETESLGDDLQIVLDEINRRRSPELPPLKMHSHLRKRNSNSHSDYALGLYLKYPQCLKEVEKHFWMDFQRLGYSRITASLPDTTAAESV